MANSYVEYTTGGTGTNQLGQTTFTVPTKFININDIHAIGYNGSTWVALTISSRATTTVTLSATPTAGSYSKLRVYRQTTNDPLVDFVDGARLTESDLDAAYRQGLYAAQEVTENASQGNTSFSVSNIANSQLAGGITTDKLAGSITSAKLSDNAITTAKITDDAVTVAKIADNAVTAAQIADNAVTSSEINANAVSLTKMAQMAQNTVIGRITSSTGNPEHVPFTLKKSVSYYTKNARNSSSSTNTANWRWGNWTEYENVGAVSDILTLSSGNYTNNDGTSITLPNSIFTFASTGTYLIEANGVIFDSDSDGGDFYSLCLTKADSQSSDTHTNMAGTQWQTDTEMNHVSANIALSVTGFADEINNPFTLVFEMVVTDTSTDKLQVACNDEGSTRTEWDAMGKIKITKLT